jgi:ATP-dependent RNA helicase DOB1
LSSVRIYLPKNLRSSENRASVGKSIEEVIKKFPHGVPLLDPLTDMHIKDEDFKKIVKKIETLENRLVTSSVHKNPELDQIYDIYQKKNEVSFNNDIIVGGGTGEFPSLHLFKCNNIF